MLSEKDKNEMAKREDGYREYALGPFELHIARMSGTLDFIIIYLWRLLICVDFFHLEKRDWRNVIAIEWNPD